MSAYTVNMNVELDDQFLVDVLTIAAEGGYMAGVDRYSTKRNEEGYVIQMRVHFEDEGVTRQVSRSTVVTGLNRILAPDFEIRSDLRSDILRDVLDREVTQIDADSSFCIIQAGLFGELVYG
jgi:hypothetical protein